MSLHNKKKEEEEEVVQPPDLDAMKTILEGAEICYEEESNDLGGVTLVLESDIIIYFGPNKELINMETQ